MKTIPYLIIFLASCAGVSDDKSLNWSGKVSEQSPNFILSYDETRRSSEPLMPTMEEWWIDVQESV